MGKPLISNAAKLGMYHTMQHLRATKVEALRPLQRDRRVTLRDEPESLLVALASQLHARDTVLVQGEDPLLAFTLTNIFPDEATRPRVLPVEDNPQLCSTVALGFALRQKLTARPTAAQPVTIALLRNAPPPANLLTLMTQHEPSLIVLLSGGAPTSRAEMQRLQHLKAPVMLVDQADTIALCRVLQESLLRARNGWGGAVIHAIPAPGGMDCMLLMEAHLRAASL